VAVAHTAQNRPFSAIPRNSVTRTCPPVLPGKYHPVDETLCRYCWCVCDMGPLTTFQTPKAEFTVTPSVVYRMGMCRGGASGICLHAGQSSLLSSLVVVVIESGSTYLSRLTLLFSSGPPAVQFHCDVSPLRTRASLRSVSPSHVPDDIQTFTVMSACFNVSLCVAGSNRRCWCWT